VPCRHIPFRPGLSSNAQVGLHAEIVRLLPDAGDVLDLGCGVNRELAGYRTARRRIWGTDLIEHPHLADRPWFRRTGPDGHLPFADASFDLVTSAWVFEHVEQPAAFLTEVHRILRPGGHLIAVTPHAWHYVTWLIRSFGLMPHWVTQTLVERLYCREHHDTFPTFYRLNSRGRIAAAGRAAGLELVDLVGFANPDYFRFSRVARFAAVQTDRLLDGLCHGLGRLYLVAVLHKPASEAAGRSGVGRLREAA
jgi:SAM-dependent methyltransferase